MKKGGIVYNLTLVTLVVITIQVYYLYNNVIPSIQEKNEEIKTQKVVLANERVHLEDLKRLFEDKDQLIQFSNAAQKALPLDDKKTSIPYHLYSVADQSGVTIASMDVKLASLDKALGAGYITVPIKIRGKYQNIVDFLKNLKKTNRITTTNQLSLQGIGGGFVETAIVVNFYYKG